MTKEANVQLMILETTPESLRAGYECPCGCRPSVAYARHGEAAYDGCCCGNEFALGPSDERRLARHGAFERETERLRAPWGEPLEAVWLIGPSTHALGDSHAHGEHHHGMGAHPQPDPAQGGVSMDSAMDPVCGMTVDRETTRAKGLVSTYQGTEHFFCGKGCKLDFDEDPARYLDPSHVPSM